MEWSTVNDLAIAEFKESRPLLVFPASESTEASENSTARMAINLHQSQGQPAVSIDAKKKELIGASDEGVF